MSDTPPSAQVTPPPPGARVGWNDWPGIPVPTLGSWTPERTVSVVVSCPEPSARLDTTLDGLAAQTYPRSLLEVIVVTGADRPPDTSGGGAGQFAVEVVAAAEGGPGARRNLGAGRARGEILMFLDAGAIPEAQYLEAHARWHHVVGNAVSLGFRRLADPPTLEGRGWRVAPGNGDMPEPAGGWVQGSPPWLEEVMRGTAELTSAHSWLWRAVDGAHLGLRRELFTEVGGFDGSGRAPEAGDAEFGFRLLQSGALLVPDRSAVCWCQAPPPGARAPDEPPSIEVRARMRDLIADPACRIPRAGRSYRVPMVVIDLRVQADDRPADILGAMHSILASDVHDLVVRVLGPVDREGPAWLAEEWRGDPRVVVGPHEPGPGIRFAPVRVATTVSARFGAETVGSILDCFADEPVGVIHIGVPWHPQPEVIEAWLTRAEQRARRAAASEGEVSRTMAGLFGERWESGLELGVESGRIDVPSGLLWPYLRADARRTARLEAGRRTGVGGAGMGRKGGRAGVASRRRGAVRAAGGRRSGRQAPAEPEGSNRTAEVTAVVVDGWLDSERRLARIRSRRSVQVADAWAALRRSRGPRRVGSALKRLAGAVLRPRQVAPPVREELIRRVTGAPGDHSGPRPPQR